VQVEKGMGVVRLQLKRQRQNWEKRTDFEPGKKQKPGLMIQQSES